MSPLFVPPFLPLVLPVVDLIEDSAHLGVVEGVGVLFKPNRLVVGFLVVGVDGLDGAILIV